MKKMKFSILLVVALLALVSVASASFPGPTNVDISYKANGYYWDVNVKTVTAPLTITDLPKTMYNGWCVGFHKYISEGNWNFVAYSSLDQASITASGMDPVNWNAVNYILNNKHNDWRITQAAMWHYDGATGVNYPEATGVSGYSHDAYDAYIRQIEANGLNFVPRCGQVYAVALYKFDKQVIIVERPTPECPNTPEFPTLALPVAMLIGVVGAVQFIKTRKE